MDVEWTETSAFGNEQGVNLLRINLANRTGSYPRNAPGSQQAPAPRMLATLPEMEIGIAPCRQSTISPDRGVDVSGEPCYFKRNFCAFSQPDTLGGQIDGQRVCRLGGWGKTSCSIV